MGVYWKILNPDAREYLSGDVPGRPDETDHPSGVHAASKAREWALGGWGGLLVMLLSTRWHGEHIEMVSDGGGDGPYYDVERDPSWRDITARALDVYAAWAHRASSARSPNDDADWLNGADRKEPPPWQAGIRPCPLGPRWIALADRGCPMNAQPAPDQRTGERPGDRP